MLGRAESRRIEPQLDPSPLPYSLLFFLTGIAISPRHLLTSENLRCVLFIIAQSYGQLNKRSKHDNLGFGLSSTVWFLCYELKQKLSGVTYRASDIEFLVAVQWSLTSFGVEVFKQALSYVRRQLELEQGGGADSIFRAKCLTILRRKLTLQPVK